MPDRPLDRWIEPEEAGSRLKPARVAAGLTIGQAAAKLGLPMPRIWEMESGRQVMSWTKLLGVVQTLGLDPRIIYPEFFPESEDKSET